MTTETDPILLPREVQQLVRLSGPTLYRMRRRGIFPEPLRLGDRRHGWRRSEVLAWLANRERASVAVDA